MHIYNLFLDLDGTLLGRSRVLHPETKAALEDTRQRGNRIFLCSGRSPVYLREGICRELEFDGIVASAGGYASVFESTPDGRKEKCIFKNSIEKPLLLRILADFERLGVRYEFESADGIYAAPETDDFFLQMICETYGLNEEQKKTQEKEFKKAWDKGINLDIKNWNPDIPVPKIVFVTDRREEFETLLPSLEENFNLNYFLQAGNLTAGELILKDCTKKTGIAKILEYYGAVPADAVGFGDSMNDLEMIGSVGTGVVSKFAPPLLLAAADLTFEDPDEGGIAKAMKKLGL